MRSNQGSLSRDLAYSRQPRVVVVMKLERPPRTGSPALGRLQAELSFRWPLASLLEKEQNKARQTKKTKKNKTTNVKSSEGAPKTERARAGNLPVDVQNLGTSVREASLPQPSVCWGSVLLFPPRGCLQASVSCFSIHLIRSAHQRLLFSACPCVTADIIEPDFSKGETARTNRGSLH